LLHMLNPMKNRGFYMAVLFSKGLDQFGEVKGQMLDIETVEEGIRLRLSHKSASVSYDVSPPADGQWHEVSVILSQTPEGIFHVKGPPTID